MGIFSVLDPKINPSSTSRKLFSFPALIAAAAAAFVCIDLLPWIGLMSGVPYLLLTALESVLILQLMAAWKDRFERLPYTHFYLLLAIFFLRVVIRIQDETGYFWALRAGSVYNAALGLLGYVCMAALHPRAYQGIERLSRAYAQWPKMKRNLVFTGFLVFFAYACHHFISYHITRDGYDWIERATLPVWQTYLREPLTIGLYRLTFLLGWERWEMTSFQTIGLLSIAAGAWWAFWLGLFTEKKWADGFDRLLAWLLFVSSGGMILLFFGHIEVYPVFIAGATPAFYFALRYFQGKRSILYAGLFFSVALLLHLSAGWLLPAFLLLPWFRNRNGWLRDVALFTAAFGAIQAVFWGSMTAIYYECSPALLLARVYEQFHVGPDRAMFLPQWVWFHPGHLFDLMNVYLYYSLPCFLLIPVFFLRLPSRLNRESAFWMLAAGGYFCYSFFWNADRGYPEDWDVFSPFTLAAVFLFLHILLPLSTEKPNQSNYSSDYQRSLIYIAALGTFAFSCAQIYFHHVVPFIPPQHR